MKPYLNIDPGSPRPDNDPENPVVYEPPTTTKDDELDDDGVGDPPETNASMRPVVSTDEDEPQIEPDRA